jgi:hypothetical protein
MASSATKVILLAAAGVGGYLLYSSYKAKNASPYPAGLLPWMNEDIFPDGTYANMGEVPPGTSPIYPVDLSMIDPTGNQPFKAYAYYPAGVPISVTHEQVMADPSRAVNGRIEVAPGVVVSPMDIYFNTDVTWGSPVQGAVASGDWMSCASIPFLDPTPMLLPSGRTPYGVSDALGRQVEYSTAALNYVNGVYGPVNGDGSPATARSAAWQKQIAADPTGKAYLDAAIKQAQSTQQQSQQQTQTAQKTSNIAAPKSNTSYSAQSLGSAKSMSQILAQSGIDLSTYHVTTNVDAAASASDNQVKASIKKSLLTSSSQSVRDNADSIATAMARTVMNKALNDPTVSVTTINPGKSNGDVVLKVMSAPATAAAPKNSVVFAGANVQNSAVIVTTNASGQKVALLGSNPSAVKGATASKINPLSFVQEKPNAAAPTTFTQATRNVVAPIPMQTATAQNMFAAAPTWMANAVKNITGGATGVKAATPVVASAPAAYAPAQVARVSSTPTPQVSASAPSWFANAMASAAATGKIGK